MTIDKELYRKAYEEHRQWNEIELKERIRNPGRLSPEEAWAQYKALWGFAVKLAGPMSLDQRRYRLAEKADYIEKIKKLEAWRALAWKASLRSRFGLRLISLKKNGYGYAIIGGIALSQLGVVRVTHDIDIKVLAPETSHSRGTRGAEASISSLSFPRCS